MKDHILVKWAFLKNNEEIVKLFDDYADIRKVKPNGDQRENNTLIYRYLKTWKADQTSRQSPRVQRNPTFNIRGHSKEIPA